MSAVTFAMLVPFTMYGLPAAEIPWFADEIMAMTGSGHPASFVDYMVRVGSGPYSIELQEMRVNGLYSFQFASPLAVFTPDELARSVYRQLIGGRLP